MKRREAFAAGLSLVLAILIDAAAPVLARHEADSSGVNAKVAALCFGIALPMSLFGAAMTEWWGHYYRMVGLLLPNGGGTMTERWGHHYLKVTSP